jgi:acetyl-CoA acetyltransferase
MRVFTKRQPMVVSWISAWRENAVSALGMTNGARDMLSTPPAIKKALALAGLSLDDIGLIELNEAFAAQALASLRELGVADDDPRVNPNGGAIALGHPLGMSGARLLLTASRELQRTGARWALATMCVGVGQGMATVLERV